MTEIRWGILGTGGIAHLQARDLVDNGFTVTAVGSRSQETADAFAAEFGIATAHASYEALVADENVDIIYVSTPHPYHASNALLALEAGKHVLVEKPFAMDAAEARTVMDAAESRGLVALEAMWTRFLPHMIHIRDLIANGALGEVRSVIADHNQKVPVDLENRFYNPALGGGALLDLGIYPVSLAVDILGIPSTVRSIATMTDGGVDLQTAIVLGFESGSQAVLQAGMGARGPNTAAIIGTEGRIEIDEVWYTATTFTRYDSVGGVVERYNEPITGRGMQYQAWEAERLINEHVECSILPPQQTVNIMEILDDVRAQIGLVFPQVEA